MHNHLDIKPLIRTRNLVLGMANCFPIVRANFDGNVTRVRTVSGPREVPSSSACAAVLVSSTDPDAKRSAFVTKHDPEG